MATPIQNIAGTNTTPTGSRMWWQNLWVWWGSRARAIRISAYVGAILLSGIGLLAWFEDWPIPGIPPEPATPAKVAYSVAPGNKDISILVQTPPDHLVEGKAVPVAILITNSTPHDLDVSIGWHAPGYMLSFNPVLNEDRDASNKFRNFFVPVPASTTVLVDLRVAAATGSGSYPITLVFWNGPNSSYKSVAYVAPIRFTSIWQLRTFRLFFLISALIRALAIPVMLAWLAYWFQQKAKEREDKAKELQESRDAWAKKAQAAHDLGSSIALNRIPEYSKFVREDYLPISRRGDTIEVEMPPALRDSQQWKEIGSKMGHLTADSPMQGVPPNEIWRLLCAILLYRARLQKFLLANGGIYFRSNQAERLFADLVNEFFGQLYLRLNKETFSEVVALLDPDDNFPSVLIRCSTTGKFAKDPTEAEDPAENLQRLRALFSALKEWILQDPADFRGYTRLVQLSSRILDFECDRPFYQTSFDEDDEPTSWYFDAPQLGFESEHYEIPPLLRAGLDPEIREYIKNVPPKCKSAIFHPFPR